MASIFVSQTDQPTRQCARLVQTHLGHDKSHVRRTSAAQTPSNPKPLVDAPTANLDTVNTGCMMEPYKH